MKYNGYVNNEKIQKTYTFIQMLFLFVLNLLSLAGLADTLLNTHLVSVYGWIDDDAVINRLVKVPLLLFPVAILLALIYFFNKEKIKKETEHLNFASEQEIKQKDFFFWVYIGITCFFVVLSASSPDWINWFK